MRIALLTYSTKPRGGVVHTLYLAEALAAAGVDVTVWSLARGGDAGFFRASTRASGCRLVPFPDQPGEGIGRAHRPVDRACCGRSPPDRSTTSCTRRTASARTPLGRCIRTMHHLDHFTTPELAACHERAIVDPYAHVCVSAAVAGELAAGWGLKRDSHPERRGRRPVRRRPRRTPAARPGGTSGARRLGRYVLTVGGIEPRKGSIELLEAYARLLRRSPPLRRGLRW